MGKFNVLIVDDIEENIYSLRLLIEDNFDLNIFTATNANDAMSILLNKRIDLILMDVQMPEVDGFEFTLYLKDLEIIKDIPIIFITGIYNNEEYKSKAYEIGGIEYITKPIDNNLLISKLKVYIDIYENLNNSKEDLVKTKNLLVHNSKMASLGEMIGIISHQLKQPLNVLSLYCDCVEYSYKEGEVDDIYVKEFSTNTKSQINYMNETINGFLDFYNPNKKKEVFNISEAINFALAILKSKIIVNNIKVNLELNEKLEIAGVKMELAQVVINIVNNSIDAFIERGIFEKDINIKLFANDSKVVLFIEDNAGGIENKNLEKILDPYYTTKVDGTGIGLYMVKLIVKNNFNGELKVMNSEKGLKFIILLDLYQKKN
ncbi:hybrid sensor histidine kinase/response regulator [Arcobacter ellisii]|uniref:histidine kinase n=1 Tax=Arcobacter ellisii TaxID=913109 RepID=A0A347U7R0_9BACT|nr:hybrid sensor histidine kinase/response regulator [Arcobacter ellisii]AXX94888.1 two-component system sensor histidine kinase/response regulator fusion protein [Arcobacter ellisii]RXI28732.1 hybrid sensor histidine kinase/response regulator [Arcobacter ellisii]